MRLKPAKQLFFAGCLLIISITSTAQFAPPAGQPGTEATHADSNVFVGWAAQCEIVRGPVKIDQQALGEASYGNATDARLKADNIAVSLGEGGLATLTFEYALWDGPGADFAVFENSFSDDFLELAFVEVSSNGMNFFRFPAISLTGSEAQIDGFGLLDATKVDRLAGKYRALYGTPFDLADLKDNVGLNTEKVTHVRIIDVVGSIDPAYARYDEAGRIINDPWPTPFPSSGFDLDAVGVIHDQRNLGVDPNTTRQFRIYPNPAIETVYLENPDQIGVTATYVCDAFGRRLIKAGDGTPVQINISALAPGIYLIECVASDLHVYQKFVKQ
ncbi:MAG: T9SS type A sorting domain-containing protein [Bacteroidetes bacterium]|nr:T9SS type A sorting domain-containing protein [Bacteroidota bacterium]